MQPYWIETNNAFRLAIVPRPRGGDWLEDDVQAMKRAGVDVVVSRLTPEEVAELGLAREAGACAEAGVAFKSFAIPDRQVPSSTGALAAFLDELRLELHKGNSVAVHCRASIGRSSLLLASLLCSEGFTATDAFTRISQARGLKVPDTPEQVRWVEEFVSMPRP